MKKKMHKQMMKPLRGHVPETNIHLDGRPVDETSATVKGKEKGRKSTEEKGSAITKRGRKKH